MPVTINVNMMTVSHKGSTGMQMSFPDVCKTPTPGGPIPIPYPNIAMSADTMNGSKTVKMDGQPIMTKGANMKMSTGDEAGSAMGVVSNKIKGKAEFVNYSFDVKVDGKNVCRLADPAQQNMGSGNAFGPAHIQGPLVVAVPQWKGCEETRKKQKEQEAAPESNWSKSGIYEGHQSKIQQVVDDMGLIIYFRASNHWCADKGWIPGKHQPKSHDHIAGQTISEGNVAKARRWIAEQEAEAEMEAKIHGVRLPFWIGPPVLPPSKAAATLLGVVMSTAGYNEGEPLKGKGRDSNGYSYKGKWVTGDYDMMDIMFVGDECKRPPQASEAFRRIKTALNKAMGWDGIQHGPQSQWVSKTSEGEFSDFSVPQLMGEWMGSPPGTPPPQVQIAEGRAPKNAVDNDLTVVAPKGAVIHLEDHDDVKNALLCCGCGR